MRSGYLWTCFIGGTGLGRMLAGLLLVVASFAALAGTVGQIDELSGPVRLLDLQGKERAAYKGGEVREGDRIATAENGRVQVRLSDGGYLSVRPNTEMVFKRFVLNETTPAQSSFWVSLLKGGFRSITGMIGKINPAGYRIETGTATIGVRGTDHEPFFVPAPGPGERVAGEPGTYDKLNSGRSYIETPKAVLDLKPGQVGFAPRLDQAPRLLPKAPDFFREQPAVPRQYLGKANAPVASGATQQAAVDNAPTEGSAADAAAETHPAEAAPATIVLTPTTSILAPSTSVLEPASTSRAAHSPVIAAPPSRAAETGAVVPLTGSAPAAELSSLATMPSGAVASDQALPENSQVGTANPSGNSGGTASSGGNASPNGNANGQTGAVGAVASTDNANANATASPGHPIAAGKANGPVHATAGGSDSGTVSGIAGGPVATEPGNRAGSPNGVGNGNANGLASAAAAGTAPGNGIGGANGVGNGNANGLASAAAEGTAPGNGIGIGNGVGNASANAPTKGAVPPAGSVPATPPGQVAPAVNTTAVANPAGRVPGSPAAGNGFVNGGGDGNFMAAPVLPSAAPVVNVPVPVNPAGNIPAAPVAARGSPAGGGKPQFQPPQAGPKPQPVSVPAPAANPGNGANKRS